jgi:hypothetical protein
MSGGDECEPETVVSPPSMAKSLRSLESGEVGVDTVQTMQSTASAEVGVCRIQSNVCRITILRRSESTERRVSRAQSLWYVESLELRVYGA